MTTYGSELSVLTYARDRLRLKVSGLSAASCFICDTPVPEVLPSQVPIATICLGDASYDEPTYMGAGPNALCEHSLLLVTVLTRCLLDPPPKAEESLIHATRGLLALKKPILTALLLSDTQACNGFADQWVPDSVEGYFLVERGFIPRGWSSPRYVDRGGNQYLGTTLSLAFSFDQELEYA